jgi:hypothetical protein
MAYVFISYVNNQMFFCNADDLLETNYENLYVTSGFDDEESAGYRTFVITTDNNMYAFRVNSEADSSVVTQLLAMFGYDRDSLEIKTVQEMVSVESVNESLEASSTSIQTDEADSESSETTDENEEVVAADTDVTDSTSSVTK